MIARTRDVRHDTGPEATLFQLCRGAHRLVWSGVRVLVTLGMSNVSYKILFQELHRNNSTEQSNRMFFTTICWNRNIIILLHFHYSWLFLDRLKCWAYLHKRSMVCTTRTYFKSRLHEIKLAREILFIDFPWHTLKEIYVTCIDFFSFVVASFTQIYCITYVPFTTQSVHGVCYAWSR